MSTVTRLNRISPEGLDMPRSELEAEAKEDLREYAHKRGLLLDAEPTVIVDLDALTIFASAPATPPAPTSRKRFK